MTRWFTGLSTLLKRAPLRQPQPPLVEGRPYRPAVIEWTDASGQVRAEPCCLTETEQDAMTVWVAASPTGPVARLLKQDTPCPVEILSSTSVPGGFELKLRYLVEGRRRERRERVRGRAILEIDGVGSVSVEVRNVSGGGIQVLSAKPAGEGVIVRINGEETVRLGVVRSCQTIAGGYRIGIQFFGANRKEMMLEAPR
jgi:hypothetical protein